MIPDAKVSTCGAAPKFEFLDLGWRSFDSEKSSSLWRGNSGSKYDKRYGRIFI